MDSKLIDWEVSEEEKKSLHRIYEFISFKEITYPAEIAKELLLSTEQILRLVNKLIQEKEIKRVILSPFELPLKLAKRIKYFWNRGIIGYNEFEKISWLEIN